MQHHFWHTIQLAIKLPLVISLFLLCACFHKDSVTIELAKHHDADTPLSTLLHSYVRSYLDYPHSSKDLYDFLTLSQAYWGDDCFDNSLSKANDTGLLKRELKRNRIRILSFPDSCFLFSRKYKIGAIAYGSPAEWQMSRTCFGFQDHWWDYSPAFLDNDGNVILQMQDFALRGEFSNLINDLIREYKGRRAILTNRFERFVHYRVLWVYTLKNGLEMFRQPGLSPLYKVDEFGNPQSLHIVVNYDCSLFSKQLEQVAGSFIARHEEVAEIRFITVIYDNEELSR